MAVEHVNGKNVGHVMLYALSTCVWCQKTRKLLDALGVAYDYEYVDLLEDVAKAEALKAVSQHNPASSFPTLVINGRCIVGFLEKEIRKALGQ